MVEKLKLWMVKPGRTNAFTLAESLLVLLVALVVLYLIPITQVSLPQRMKMAQVKQACIQAQMKAYLTQKKVSITLFKNGIVVDDKTQWIEGIGCEHALFHYNEKGNISQALSVQCKQAKLVFQLGLGRVRVEN